MTEATISRTVLVSSKYYRSRVLLRKMKVEVARPPKLAVQSIAV